MTEQRETAQANLAALTENPYPGRGIAMGLSESGEIARQVYWLMGRSDPSRNRVLVREGDAIRTEAHDPSMDVGDPELTIYNAMTQSAGAHIVSNGRQTDAIASGFTAKGRGASFEATLRDWKYEPDPNHTPRVSGLVVPYGRQRGEDVAEFGFSVIRKDAASDEPVRSYRRGALSVAERGLGRCVHTYLGNGDPLPAFDKDPYLVPIGDHLEDAAATFWDSLDQGNRVALAIKDIHLMTGTVSYYLVNTREPQASTIA